MSTTTSNYNLIKPELTDVADITATNSNWDTIDTTMKSLEADVEAAQTTADNAIPKSGGTFTGAVTLNGAPTASLHAATKAYADTKMPKSGGTFTGTVTASDANTDWYHLRNICVTAKDGVNAVSTGRIVMVRK